MTSDEVSQVGQSSTRAVYEALSFSDSNEFIDMPFGVDVQSQASVLDPKTQSFINKRLNQTNNLIHSISLPSGISISESYQCDLSGSVKLSGNFNESNNTGKMTLVFNNCKDDYDDGDYDITNGTAVWTNSVSGDKSTIRMDFKNYTLIDHFDGITETSKINGYYQVTLNGIIDDMDGDIFNPQSTYIAKWDLSGSFNGKPTASKGEMDCSNNGCQFSTVVQAEDGNTYRVDDLTVTNNHWGDIESAEGTFYHPDYGHYKFEAEIDYLCDDEDLSPFVGKAVYTDNNKNSITYFSSRCSSRPTVY